MLLVGVIAWTGWWFVPVAGPRAGRCRDEALMASPARQAASFPAADEDYFRDMDQTGTVRRC